MQLVKFYPLIHVAYGLNWSFHSTVSCWQKNGGQQHQRPCNKLDSKPWTRFNNWRKDRLLIRAAWCRKEDLYLSAGWKLWQNKQKHKKLETHPNKALFHCQDHVHKHQWCNKPSMISFLLKGINCYSKSLQIQNFEQSCLPKCQINIYCRFSKRKIPDGIETWGELWSELIIRSQPKCVNPNR